MSWELIDRVQGRIGTKKPQAMRFSQGLGTSELCFLSKNDASDQKRGKKTQDLCGFQAFLLFEIVHFPKKMWKTGGAILMRKSENYHAMLGW